MFADLETVHMKMDSARKVRYEPLKRQAKFAADDILKFFIFQRKQVLIFHVNRLLSWRFTWNIKTCFHLKIEKKKIKIVVCFSFDWRFKG